MSPDKRPQAKPWHATCGKHGMARTINTFRMSQETLGQASVTNRQPMQIAAALYLAQLRRHVLKVTPRLRRQIAIPIVEKPEAPHMVKIIHAGSI